MRLITWRANSPHAAVVMVQRALGAPRMVDSEGGPVSASTVFCWGPDWAADSAVELLPSVSVLTFVGSGNGKVAVSAPCKLSASLTSRCVTAFNTKPGATLAPTPKGRGGCLSTEINATPWPDALAITPMARKRSVGPSAAPASVGRGAPSTRASSAGVPARIGASAGVDRVVAAVTAGISSAESAAIVQYPVHSRAVPSNRAVTQRRRDSVSKFIMIKTSSTHAYRPCKRDRGLLACGFTLIELMVVLVIIGVLAALIVPNVLDRADDARISAARVDVNNLMQALKLYRLDNQRYPTAEQGLQALVQRPNSPPVPTSWKATIDKLPNDPWGNPYVYLNPGLKGEVDVMSYGADGKPGGENKDADIGSWQ